jgi:methylmalonyl-CoA carboxyltransferase large subunit
MATITVIDLEAQIAALTRRLAELEAKSAPAPPATVPQVALATVPQAAPPPVVEGITEEEVLAISAAVAAFLGVRAHIRQIRLVSGNAWAQQGRVSIQASHMLG